MSAGQNMKATDCGDPLTFLCHQQIDISSLLLHVAMAGAASLWCLMSDGSDDDDDDARS